MDQLSKDELIFEIGLGQTSRFSKSIAYLKYRLEKIKEGERSDERIEDKKINEVAIELSQEANAISKDANTISEESNEISNKANSLSKWAIGISVMAFLISVGVLAIEIHKLSKP